MSNVAMSANEGTSIPVHLSISRPKEETTSISTLIIEPRRKRQRDRSSYRLAPTRVALFVMTFFFHTFLCPSFLSSCCVSAYVVGESDIDGGRTHGKILLDGISYLSLLQPNNDIIRDILDNEISSLIRGLIDAQFSGGTIKFLTDSNKATFGRNAFSHFYNPTSQEGYKAAKTKGYNRVLERMGWLNYKFTQTLGPAMDSTEMIDWYYTKAVQLYRVNRTESVKALASATHILQDATVPQHATDCGNENGDACRHYQYEKIVDERYSSWALSPEPPNSDNGRTSKTLMGTNEEFLSNNIMTEQDIVSFAADQPPHELVKFAAGIAEGHMEYAKSPRLTDVQMVAGVLVPFAQQLTATLLLKFSQDVRKSDVEVSKRAEAIILKITSVRMEGPLTGEKTAADFRPVVRYPNVTKPRTRGYTANKNRVDPLGGYDAFGWTFVQWVDGGVSTNTKEVPDATPIVTFWLSIEDVHSNQGCRRKCGSKRKNLIVGTGGRTEVDIRLALDQRASEQPDYSFTTGCDDTKLIQDGCQNTVRVEYTIGRSYLVTGSYQEAQTVKFSNTVTGAGMTGFIFILILSFICLVLSCFYASKRSIRYYKERQNPKNVFAVNEVTVNDDPYGGMQNQASARSFINQDDAEYLNDEFLDGDLDGNAAIGGMIVGGGPLPPMDRRNSFSRRRSSGDLSGSGRGQRRGRGGLLSNSHHSGRGGDFAAEAMCGSNHSGRRGSLNGSGRNSNHRRGSGSMGGSGRSLQRRGSGTSFIDNMGHPQRHMGVKSKSSSDLYDREQERQGMAAGGGSSQSISKSFRMKRAPSNGARPLDTSADKSAAGNSIMMMKRPSFSTSSRRNLMENNNLDRMPSQVDMGSNGERKTRQLLPGSSHHSARSFMAGGGNEEQRPGQAPMESIKTKRLSSNGGTQGRRSSFGAERNGSGRMRVGGVENQTDKSIKRRMSGPSPQPFSNGMGERGSQGGDILPGGSPLLNKSIAVKKKNSFSNKGERGKLGKSLQKLSAEQQVEGPKGLEITAQSVAGVSVLSSGGISTAKFRRPGVQPYQHVSPPVTDNMPVARNIQNPLPRSNSTGNSFGAGSRRNLNQHLTSDEQQRPRRRLEQESIS